MGEIVLDKQYYFSKKLIKQLVAVIQNILYLLLTDI